MERLTERTVAGTVNLRYPKCCYYADGGKDQIAISAYRQNAFERLAAYEDAMPLERAQELAQAEKDGRLVVLPCKVGDVIYMPVGRYEITGFENDMCDGYYIDCNGILQIKAKCNSGNHATYGVPGRTVFLTREEAEAALKKGGITT